MRYWFTITLTLTALLLGTSFAHTLEAIPKLSYDADFWIKAQQSLYGYYAVIGGPVEVGSILFSAITAWLLRKQRAPVIIATSGSICLSIAFLVIWVFVTRAVNAEVITWTPTMFPAYWDVWRLQWEISHISRFALHLSGFVLLTWAILSAHHDPQNTA